MLVVASSALGDVPDEGLPAAIGKDLGAHLHGQQGSVLPLERPFRRERPPRGEHRGPLCREARSLVGRDEVEDRPADYLVGAVAEHPGRRLIDLDVAALEVRKEKRIGRELDELARPGFRAPGEPRDVHHQQALDDEEGRLEDRLRQRIACAHDELIGSERRTEKRGEDTGSASARQARHQDGAEEEHEWRPGARHGLEQLSQPERSDHYGHSQGVPHQWLVYERPRGGAGGHTNEPSTFSAATFRAGSRGRARVPDCTLAR